MCFSNLAKVETNTQKEKPTVEESKKEEAPSRVIGEFEKSL